MKILPSILEKLKLRPKNPFKIINVKDFKRREFFEILRNANTLAQDVEWELFIKGYRDIYLFYGYVDSLMKKLEISTSKNYTLHSYLKPLK